MKLIVAGGGTAGHINPGLSVAKIVLSREPDSEIVFVGTDRGLETKLVPREGFELWMIDARGFRRKLTLQTFTAVKDNIKGFFQAFGLVKAFRPDAVLGTGGYVCGPVVFSARLLGIPTVIHEQNVFPGVTNRLLSRVADISAVSFSESSKYFKRARKIVTTGNPVRMEILENSKESSRKKLGLLQSDKVVVIFGGSRGAAPINTAVAEMLIKQYKKDSFKLFFATGEDQYDKVMELLSGYDNPDVKIVPYIYNSELLLPAADLMVSRAGAITCGEVTAIGLPSIMIPSPYVTANHQEYNARTLERSGAAVVIEEKDLNAALLYNSITNLLGDGGRLAWMSKCASMIGSRVSAVKIYEQLAGLVNQRCK